jgi:hypothetical protein
MRFGRLNKMCSMIFRYSILFFIPFLLCSCASYLPISEGIIYHDQDVEPYNVKYASPFGHGENGFTLSYMILPGALRQEVRREYEDDLYDNADLIFKEQFLIAPPMPSFSIPLAYKAAMSFSMIPLYPGVDATVHLFEDIWLTGSVQSPLFLKINTEFILQRPVYRVPNGGVSVGLFYRYNHLSFFREGEQIRISDLIPSTFPLEWYGGRVTAQLPDNLLNNRFRIHLNGGYSSMYGSALFTLGIGMSFRPQPRVRLPEPIRF